jgi:iron(III) transport system substrate-binding protein
MSSETVRVYSSRHYGGDEALFAAFTQKTGIKVEAVEGKSSALIARVESEGKGCPADLLLIVDAGNLGKAAQTGLFQAANDPALQANVPDHFREQSNLWVGLGRRHRIMVHAPDRLPAAKMPTYLGLTDPQWKGKVAIRSSSNIYNQSLLAGLIAHYGEEQATAWAKGVVANMARKPQGNDRAQIAAVASGEADIAVVNHYYYAKMLNSSDPAEVENAKKVAVYFPDQGEGHYGASTNISGAGILKHAPNPTAAEKLLVFLSSAEGQALYIGPSQEFAIRDDVENTSGLWPKFKADTLPMSELADHNRDAVRVFDRAGWR